MVGENSVSLGELEERLGGKGTRLTTVGELLVRFLPNGNWIFWAKLTLSAAFDNQLLRLIILLPSNTHR